MSDLRGNGLNPWLEGELTRQFGPVAAPESLWDGVCQPRTKRRAALVAPRMLWPAMTTLLLIASCLLVWQIGHARTTPLSALELQAIAADPGHLDFQSADPAEIRHWVKAKCNIDIDLPARQHENIRLLGARLIRRPGATIAAVAFRIDGKPATLLMSEKRTGLDNLAWAGGAWSITNVAQEACRHCHAGAPGLHAEPRL